MSIEMEKNGVRTPLSNEGEVPQAIFWVGGKKWGGQFLEGFLMRMEGAVVNFADGSIMAFGGGIDPKDPEAVTVQPIRPPLVQLVPQQDPRAVAQQMQPRRQPTRLFRP